MSCFLIVGCGSSSKMNGTWVYNRTESSAANTSITINSGLESFVIKNGNTIVIDGKSSKLKKSYLENGIQYYDLGSGSVSYTDGSESGNANFSEFMYYDETDDTIHFVSDLGLFTADSIYTRQ